MMPPMAEARPRFRRDLSARRVTEGGFDFVDVNDREGTVSYRLYAFEHVVALELDGRPLDDVRTGLATRLPGLELSLVQLEGFVTRLRELRLLEAAAEAREERSPSAERVVAPAEAPSAPDDDEFDSATRAEPLPSIMETPAGDGEATEIISDMPTMLADIAAQGGAAAQTVLAAQGKGAGPRPSPVANRPVSPIPAPTPTPGGQMSDYPDTPPPESLDLGAQAGPAPRPRDEMPTPSPRRTGSRPVAPANGGPGRPWDPAPSAPEPRPEWSPPIAAPASLGGPFAARPADPFPLAQEVPMPPPVSLMAAQVPPPRRSRAAVWAILGLVAAVATAAVVYVFVTKSAGGPTSVRTMRAHRESAYLLFAATAAPAAAARTANRITFALPQEPAEQARRLAFCLVASAPPTATVVTGDEAVVPCRLPSLVAGTEERGLTIELAAPPPGDGPLRLVRARLTGVVRLPAAALRLAGTPSGATTLARAYVLDADGRVESRPVALAEPLGSEPAAVVTQGLDEGDTVIIAAPDGVAVGGRAQAAR